MLQDQAMLANVIICMWTARKHDKTVSQEVDKIHSSKDGGRYNKILIDPLLLRPLITHAGRVRSYHYQQTLPWGDNGDRLLPAVSYMEYLREIGRLTSENERLVEEFVKQYPTIVNDAAARLGSLYDPKDYPRVDEIASRFSIKSVLMPIPSTADFRIDVPTEALDEMKATMQSQIDNMVVRAEKECWSRLYDSLSHLSEVLDREKTPIRANLLESVHVVAITAKRLNINRVAFLDAICDEIVGQLTTSLYQLRSSARARQQTKDVADGFLKRIQNRLQSFK
jgi:hypothetical protein